MQYADEGYLPEAVINYLARLGWSHGDEEIFSAEQFCLWFDLDHITPSAAQFNTEKLRWLNQHYIKQADNARLAGLVSQHLAKRNVEVSATPQLEAVIALYKERVATLLELADEAAVFYTDIQPAQELLDTHLTPDVLPALQELAAGLGDVAWEAPAIAAFIKTLLAKHNLKMPKLAMPLRVTLVGKTHTPSVDAVLALFTKSSVIERLQRYI
jgi:glutamyl-tRNA synthetase